MQAVLTALAVASSPDSLLVSRGHQGGSGCPKTKIVKRLFEDQEDAGTTPKDEACIEDAGGAAAAPAPARQRLLPRWRCSGCSPAGGEEPAAAPAVAEPPAQPERLGDGVARRLKADAD